MAKYHRTLVVTNNFIKADNGYGRACRDGLIHYQKVSDEVDYLEIVQRRVYFNGEFMEELKAFSFLRPTIVRNRLGKVPEKIYDLVVFEDLLVAINYAKFNTKKYLLRLHNLMSEENWPFYMSIQYYFLRKFEKESIRRMKIACLSKDMQASISKTYNVTSQVIGLIPKLHSFNRQKDTLDCLAIGTWGFRKRKDLIAIMERWPRDMTLHIVGLKSEILRKYQKENIIIHGQLEDIEGLVKKATFLLNPQRQGSGLNIKTLFAIENGLVPLTTQFGAEGFGLVSNDNYIDIDAVDFSKIGSIDLQKIRENNKRWIRKFI